MAALEAASAELEALRISDRDVFALTLYGEARGAGALGLVAVAWVILNRSKRRRQSIRRVCLQWRQFSCWFPGGGRENHAAVMAAARGVAAGAPPAALARCRWVVDGMINGWIPGGDPTGGGLFYYAPEAMVPRGAVPEHLRGIAPTAAIAGHLFFDRSL